MELLVKEILKNKEVTMLPSLLDSGDLPALISGLSPVHRAHLAAALTQETKLPLFVICSDDSAAESMAKDLQIMLNRQCCTILMRDFTFNPAEAVSRQQEQKRIKSLFSLCCGESSLTVASISGLMQRTIPKEVLQQAACKIEMTQTYEIDDIQESLLRCGYTRSDQVEGPGQFARRGGIIDFYSPGEKSPVRIEFWGDEIDSMGYFDIATQRREEMVESCLILPAAEALPSLSPMGKDKLCETLEELAQRYAKKRNSENAAALAAEIQADTERLRSGVILSDADRYMPLFYPAACGADYIPENAIVFFDQPRRCAERGRDYIKQLGEDVKEQQRRARMPAGAEHFCLSFEAMMKRLEKYPVYMADAFALGQPPLAPRTLGSMMAKQLPSYAGNAQAACDDVKLYLKQEYRVVILAGDERRAGVLQEYLGREGITGGIQPKLLALPEKGKVTISIGSLSAGMEYPGIGLAVLTDSQIIRKTKTAGKKKLPANRKRITSCADLAVGDYVVHENHGIGRFAGIMRMQVDGFEKDYIKILYAGTDSLYVPATQLDMVTKYTGGGEDKPVKLSKMGGVEWAKTRSRAKKAAKDMADKLIALYAQRQRRPGYAFSPDSEWQREFEDNFGYTETDDQLRCVAEIKKDMESSVPMDRLLCGDVGFGKTEVAMRAIMKCVLDGKQAAVLVPTTVLAQQHYQTALQRFFGFPVNIAVLSRFKTGSQYTKTLADLRSGACDLVIGTHRLLSKDIQFKDLGLLVVDEEQRFGVTHKEHIKEISQGVDVLTLSATPIPRTLNMAMSGIRDMSTIEEPPEDRLPVQTYVLEHDWAVLADAIRRELQRGGQVYYLHNRVEDIERCASRLRKQLEDQEISIAVAHGKMEKTALAAVMESMSAGEVQVLVCTTIIETGIDIPNVNTLIIEDADRLGLAQLHQIRGRVGRSTRRASAYLTFRRDKCLTEIAEKRLNAIRDFAQFGSGFKIAMRDLEIRGAGNLLGAEQSGHMIDVGYDMYMKLLSEAVLEARGVPQMPRADCSADLAVAANIPDRYIPNGEQRMDIYRRIALIRTEEEADDLTDELIDRFGEPPSGVNALIHVALLRGEAGKAGIREITQKQGYLRFTVKEFDMEKVSSLYEMPEYKGRLRVEAGSKPCLSLRLKSKNRVIDEARRFTADWGRNVNKQ